MIPFRGIHAFQACQFNHSCIYPCLLPYARHISVRRPERGLGRTKIRHFAQSAKFSVRNLCRSLPVCEFRCKSVDSRPGSRPDVFRAIVCPGKAANCPAWGPENMEPSPHLGSVFRPRGCAGWPEASQSRRTTAGLRPAGCECPYRTICPMAV